MTALKIKDDVDLSCLKEYGWKKSSSSKLWVLLEEDNRSGKPYMFIDPDDRTIQVSCKVTWYSRSIDGSIMDMILNGLIEVVKCI